VSTFSFDDWDKERDGYDKKLPEGHYQMVVETIDLKEINAKRTMVWNLRVFHPEKFKGQEHTKFQNLEHPVGRKIAIEEIEIAAKSPLPEGPLNKVIPAFIDKLARAVITIHHYQNDAGYWQDKILGRGVSTVDHVTQKAEDVFPEQAEEKPLVVDPSDVPF
jgi:hypothetical protein